MPTPRVPDKGPHYSLIKERAPSWLLGTSWARAQALSTTRLSIEPWHHRASAALKQANAQAWVTQNNVDERLKAVQDVYAFAEPLLIDALKKHYAFEENVRDTYLFLHIAKGTVIKGTASRTVSLLDAAVQNFSNRETFTDSSSYITRPDARGHFMIKPFKHQVSIAQFIALCRKLDLGAQYQRHVRQHLLPAELKAPLIASQQAALGLAAHIALARGDIEPGQFHLLQRTLKGERGIMQFYELKMMDTVLTGILLIAADLGSSTFITPVLAYTPHDPVAPIQHYTSTVALIKALREKLRDTNYQRFFSQFVDQQQRAHFFNGLGGAHVPFGALRIDGDLWTYRYQRSLDKVLNDARVLAVSTADSDSRARWAWWDSVSGALEEIFNAALLVVTPFVPFLGELMLAYTAYQLLDEVVEGVVDLAEGLAVEAAENLVGVVSDVVQLGAFGVAGHLVPSLFVNQLKAVKVNGQARLWNPDLRPYAQKDFALPGNTTPDDLGLHAHAGQHILPLDGEHYAVTLDPESGAHRIRHPTRADAYAPYLEHNGQGAWTHEAETPRTWDTPQLMRRLGHSVQDLNDAQLDQVRTLSGTEHAVLRAMHADNTPPPPLLTDSLKRFRLNEEARQLPERIRTGKPADEHTYWSAQMATELPGWPQDLAIRIYEGPATHGDSLLYGANEPTRTLHITRQDLNAGKLPERLLEVLDEAEQRSVLNTLPSEHLARIDALRQRMADQLASHHRQVLDYLYNNSEYLTHAEEVLVRQAVPGLPKSLIQRLLQQARPDELQIMKEHQRLPLRLKNQATELLIHSRATHAYEGFYHPALMTADSEQLLLNTLKLHSDAFGSQRVEVRKQSYLGDLRATAGPGNAREVRVLVRDDNGQYEVQDDQRNRLHPATDFYSAVLLTLPADTLAARDGASLRTWLMTLLAPIEERRTTLAAAPPPERKTETLLQKPRFKWASKLLGITPPTVEERVKALYPRLRADKVLERVQTYSSAEGEPVLRALEREKKALARELDNWIKAPTQRHEGNITRQEEERMVRVQLARALRQSWENATCGYVDNFGERQSGAHLNLEGWPLGQYLKTMPGPCEGFNRITSMTVTNSAFSDDQAEFLSLFPNVVALELSNNRLTYLPEAVMAMPRLGQLGLGENPLVWGRHSLDRLKRLRHLKVLDLSFNRLMSEPPDVGGMPHLRELYLRNTSLTQWPDGLFEVQRPEQFFLDLQNTEIKTVPQFLPWQPQAELVARTRLDRNQLGLDDQERMVSYRLAAGLDPWRTYPPRGEQDSRFWWDHLGSAEKARRRAQWDELENEHGSQGFFDVLRSLQLPEFFETDQDAIDYRLNHNELTANVWRMLDAIHQDEALRKRFFTMASTPGNCADASAQIFNNLGVQTLVHEAYSARAGLTPPAFSGRLAALARQKARLDMVNAIAEDEVARRLTPAEMGGPGLRLTTEVIDGVPGSVDEVQVHAAYQTALKQRLDLPWLASHMVYRETARVDAQMIDEAFEQVTRREQGDGLINRMLNVDFWDEYLDATYADELQQNTRFYQAKAEQVDDLQQAQHAWVQASNAAREALRQPLKVLADALGVPDDEVFIEQPIPQTTCDRLLLALASEEKNLARRLTREALKPVN
ncbi:NEL-type E3 ubiquitin ligase domain-containing protein [Pseudomonas costantinii]|uniref:RING-type E3 ubiquitin transferase n=1 Tax=Pseudomonas costantinii TaxID=168469 RepID=A0A1S2UDG9_9PSED|nr:NEL-type E3 ubiquitin ligase domain-containing protein [Pseudomonas costantinii]NVZ18269.1 hypothetical protein [Pseudomonas costantinii]OIN43958.1 hypothetical protein BFL40_31380 [Pseudomonas costantinii]SEE24487.1 C-terminal novel E3 ligase, LRR-interacting [Pseudomonas costantinii]